MQTILLHPTYFPSIAQMVAVAGAETVVFEIHDNYQKQTYRNRAYIAHSNGKLLLNVPIKHSGDGSRQKTSEVVPDTSFPWQSQHWKSLQSAYRTSPFFEYYEDELEFLFTDKAGSLLEHNLKIFELLTELIGIEVKTEFTKSYKPEYAEGDLRKLVVAKKEKAYGLEPYIQVLQQAHGFIPNLSVLDLLFNEGPNTLNYLQRQPADF